MPDLGSPDAWKSRFCQLSSIILHKMLTTASKHSEHFAALRQRSTEQCIVTVSFAPRLVGSAAPPTAMKSFIVVPSGKSRDFRGEGRPMGIVPATCLHVIPRAPGCSFPWCSWMSFKRHHWRRLRLRYPQLVEPSLSPRSDGLAHRNVCQKKGTYQYDHLEEEMPDRDLCLQIVTFSHICKWVGGVQYELSNTRHKNGKRRSRTKLNNTAAKEMPTSVELLSSPRSSTDDSKTQHSNEIGWLILQHTEQDRVCWKRPKVSSSCDGAMYRWHAFIGIAVGAAHTVFQLHRCMCRLNRRSFVRSLNCLPAYTLIWWLTISKSV